MFGTLLEASIVVESEEVLQLLLRMMLQEVISQMDQENQ